MVLDVMSVLSSCMHTIICSFVKPVSSLNSKEPRAETAVYLAEEHIDFWLFPKYVKQKGRS